MLPQIPTHRLITVLAVLTAGVSGPVAPVAAQSASWATQLVVPAYPSPFLSEWERNPQNLTLSVAYFGSEIVDYRVEGVLRSGGGVLARAESPTFTMPGGPVNEIYTGDDLLGWRVQVQEARAEQVVRTGVMPEDDYEICVRIVSEQGIQLAESCSFFSVALPRAPQLLFPDERQGVRTFQPTFQWTPTTLPVDLGTSYRVTIVPLLGSQTPGSAVRSNLPVFDDVVEAPVLVYPLDALELEDGQRYAWRVEALDGFGDPVVPGGLFSETWTFTATSERSGTPWDPERDGLPETLPLVPGLATLTDLGAVEMESTGTGWLLNGPAGLLLEGPYQERARVRLEDLEVDDFAGALAVRDGRVRAQLRRPLDVGSSVPVFIREVSFEPGAGLTATASLQLPDGSDLPLDGQLQVTPGGVFGTLTTEERQDPVWRGGRDPVDLSITDLEVRLPGGTVVATGRATLFGGAAICDQLSAAIGADGIWSVTPLCLPAEGGDEAFAVRLGVVRGALSADLGSGVLDYGLAASARLDLNPQGTNCSLRFDAEARSGEPVSVDGLTSRCDAARAAFDAGWIRMGLSGLTADGVSYDPGVGFDFDARIDLAPELPGLGALELPTLVGVTLGASGIRLPEATLPVTQPGLDLGGFGLTVDDLRTAPTTIGWSDWNAQRLPDFRVDFGAGLTLPNLPASTPSCLAASVPSIAAGSVSEGALTLVVADGSDFQPPCVVALAPSVAPDLLLEVEGWAGPVVVSLEDGVDVREGLGLRGALRLPEPFSCGPDSGRLALDGHLGLLPDGGISGRTPTLPGGCAVQIAGFTLELLAGEVSLQGLGSESNEPRLVTDVRLQAGGSTGAAELDGELTLDLRTGELLAGSVELPGPLEMGLPQDEPVFRFVLGAASLAADGLRVDGRHELVFPDDSRMGVTFDEVRLSVDGDSFLSGTVLFDAAFGLEGGIEASGSVAWRAVSSDTGFGLESGFRVDLPAQVSLGPEGLEVAGEGAARLIYGGRDVTELDGLFRDGFTLDTSPVVVSQGYLDLMTNGRRLAYVDDAGFHPDLGILGADLLPARLGLPSQSIAYLELRDDEGDLRLMEEEHPDGVRLYTLPGATIPLVLPALAFEGAEAPEVEVAVDVVVGSGLSLEVVSGEVTVSADPGAQPELDLSQAGIPFRITAMTFGDPDGDGMRWRMEGEPVLFGAPLSAGTVALELTGDSRLAGQVDVPFLASVALAGDGTVLRFDHERLVGSFDVSLPDAGGHWSLSLEGALTLDLDGSGGLEVDATLEASALGVAFTSLAATADLPPVFFDAGVLELGVTDVRVPLLAWSDAGGWDFELLVDGALRFPQLGGVSTGFVEDLTLGPDGLGFPALDIPALEGSFDLSGFRVTANGLRLPAVQLDPFGSGIAVDWAPRFDLALQLADAATERWPDLAGVTLSLLDVALGADGFTGTFEPRSLLTPIALELSEGGLALELTDFSGGLSVLDGLQRVDLQAGGRLVLPQELRCAAAPSPVVELPTTTLEVFPNGGFGGRLEDVAVDCPLQLGPLELTLTDADLVFAFVDDVQQVNVFTDASLTLPGTTPGTFVSASGSLDLSLLEPEVIGGGIAIDEPFVWDVPADDPLLTLQVQQAELDNRGFVLDGSGVALLADGAPGPSVTFAGLTFDRHGDIVAGSATLAAGLALDGTLEGARLDWALADPQQNLTDEGFRLGLEGSATLDSDGLALAGSGTAQLNFADSAFAALDVAFSDGFTLTPRATRVSAGRADFELNGTEIAFVDRRGFFPGDLFGILPLPDRIPLPSEDVAYLEVRDPTTGVSLVQSGSVAGGLEVATAPGEPVWLVLPGLLDASGAPTRVPAEFSLVLNGSSFAVASGSLDLNAPAGSALFDLESLGLPLAVTRIAYDPDVADAPRLDLRLRLPEALDSIDVGFQGVSVSAGGLEGQVVVDGSPLASATLGELSLVVDEARATFGGTAGVTFSGSLGSGFFRDPNGSEPRVSYVANVDADGSLDITVDASSLPQGRFPLGQAYFQPASVGSTPALTVTATDELFALNLSGVLGLPGVADGFELSLEGLTVGTNGISLPDLSLSGALDRQTFELFGATFTLRDTEAGPGIGLSLSEQVLLLTLNGDVDFLGRTLEFEGLSVGTDGRLAMSGAALIDDAVALVPGTVVLQALAIQNRSLRADLAIDLPAPFDQVGTQTASFTVASDGSVSGGGSVTLLDESQGLGGSRTQFAGPLATSHLRYLGVRIGTSRSAPGAVEAVGDVYLGGDEDNRIGIGRRTGQTVEAGLSVEFDGDVRWGSVTLARSFDFDYEMLRLTVDNVTSSSGAAGLGIGLGGHLSVDVPLVTGGIQYSGFGVDPDLSFTTDDAAVQGGSLTIAGVLSLSLSDFAYSASPTTLTGVRSGSLPTASAASGATSSSDIQVSTLLTFGGTVSIGSGCGTQGDCLLSGGVDQVLFYKTAPEQGSLTHLVVRRANLSVANALSMEADLTYRQVGTNGGFELMFGGSADFQAMDVAVVGALEYAGSAASMRAGLFLVASGRLELIPVVLALTDLGGGFFYNPRPEYCQLVRQYSGVSDLSSNGNSCEDAGRFTGFLFAGAELVERSIGRAQVLLTVSERRFQLDGEMALLSPGSGAISDAAIRGTVYLAVGFQELFAEGNIKLHVDYAPLISAGSGDSVAELGFFVYGADAWGVYGGLSIDILTVIGGRAEFFVGPPGFYIEAELRAGFDFWIIAVEAWAITAVWLVDDGWGAYLDVGVSASIAGGAVRGKGQLRGALVSAPGEPVLVYASALAEGCVLFLCADAWISAEFRGGTPSGSFGRNSTFDRIIAEQRRVKAKFEAERDALQEKIQAAQLMAGMALTDQQLADIYARIQDENLSGIFLATAILEYTRYPEEVKSLFGGFDSNPWWTQEYDYYMWYSDLVGQVGSPLDTQSPSIESFYADVAAGVQQLQTNRGIVQVKLAEAMAEIEELESAVDFTGIAGSPITASSFGPPQTIDNGDGTRTLVSGPSVELDRAAADDMRAELLVLQAEADRYAAEVARRIEQIEAGLAWIDYLVLDTASTAPLGFVRDYADVLETIEEQYARHGDLMLRQQDWYRTSLQELSARRVDFDAYIHRKSLVILHNADDPQGALEALIELRANTLDALSDESDLASTFVENTADIDDVTPGVLESYKEVADSLGRQLWYDIARVGMAVADTAAGAAFDSIRARADDELRDRWRAHAAMTLDIHRAMAARAELAAGLYDLYVEYQRVFPTQSSIPRTMSLAELSNPFLSEALDRAAFFQQLVTLMNRTQALEAQFQVPSVDHVVVVSKNEGYMAKETFWWEASHPTAVHEYLYNSIEGDVGILNMLGMQSNGVANVRESYVLTPGRGTTTQDRTLRVGARGGAGYVGYGRASYQTRFEGGAGGQPVGQAQAWGQSPDVSPPSTPSVRLGGHPSTTRVFWTSSTQTIDTVRYSALDLQSGIGGYEYAVGWADDTTAVRGWTDVGGRQSIRVRGLDLQPGGPAVAPAASTFDATSPFFQPEWLELDPSALEAPGYRVFVRARNGAGLRGTAGRSAPIRVDLTPPAFPDTATIRRPIYALTHNTFFFLGSGGSTPTDPVFASASPVCAPPPPPASYDGSGTFTPLIQPIWFTVLPPAETPAITFQLPRAQDVGSGVARYAWRVGSEPADTYSPAGWSTTVGTPDTLRIEGPPLVYQDSLYFSLVAIDGVGFVSDPIHFGPFVTPDPTDPVGASFCATTGTAPNRIRMRVSSAGVDPETGITGWSYRIRRSDGALVRDWPAAPDYTSLSNGQVLDTEALPLQDGDQVYAEIRVTNGAGRTTITASGPLDIDLTPPPAPVIRAVAPRRSGAYTILGAEHRTSADPGLTHRWYLLAQDGSGLVAQGGLPGTGGVFRIQDIPVQTSSGDALPPGTYTLLMVSRTSSGISSADGTFTVVVP